MYFLFVLVICLLPLSALVKDKCYSLEEDIYKDLFVPTAKNIDKLY